MFRVCLHTDKRNERLAAAMERIGAKFEGILRAHRMAADVIPRDSARYSIVAAEWPDVKHRLEERLVRPRGDFRKYRGRVLSWYPTISVEKNGKDGARKS